MPDGTMHLITKHSARFATGNLTCDGKRLVYAGRRNTAVATFTNESLKRGQAVISRGSYGGVVPVVAAAVCPTGDGSSVVVTATQEGVVLVYDGPAQHLVGEDQSCSGERLTSVAGDGSGRVYVGRSSGDLLALTIEGGRLAGPGERVALGTVGVWCVAAGPGGALAAGCENGTVHVAEVRDGSAVVVASVSTSKHPITAICLCGGTVVAGNSVGRLFFVDASTGALLAEAAAHTRTVTALAAHDGGERVASVSEDTWVNVWSLPRGTVDGNLSVLLSRRIESCLLTGVAFCGEDGEALAFTAYDSGTIRVVPVAPKP